MVAQILDGKALAKETLEHLAVEVEQHLAAGHERPCIVTVLVGDNPDSATYVKMKINRARKAGIEARRVDLPGDTTTDQLVKTIADLSADSSVHGILLQHPVPEQIDERAAFEAIAVDKDVDGVTYGSFARAAFGHPTFVCATPGGIVRLLEHYDIPLAGADVTVVGQGPILGKPLSAMLLAHGATVTSCHKLTRDLRSHIEGADIVIAAAGVPELVKGEWIKPGAVVIDAGYTDHRGDVQFEAASERASWITPVPGGVGPMTIATLLAQTVDSAKRLVPSH